LDLNQNIIKIISDFVIELLSNDEFQMARLLRKKLFKRIDKNLENTDQSIDDKKVSDSKSVITPYLHSFYR
jgi:hypothetical protein